MTGGKHSPPKLITLLRSEQFKAGEENPKEFTKS